MSINSKSKLMEYLLQDAKASGRTSTKPNFWGDEIWKFQVSLRKLEYYTNTAHNSLMYLIPKFFYK